MDSLVASVVPYMQVCGLMAPRMPPESPESPQAVGKRLKALRDALDLSQDDIAASIGMASGSASWSPYEKGKDMIPAHNALALCRRYGVTMDWLYRGLWHAGVPFDLGELIRYEEMGAEGAKSSAIRRSSRSPTRQARGRIPRP